MTVNDLDMTLALRMSVNSLFTQVVSLLQGKQRIPSNGEIAFSAFMATA